MSIKTLKEALEHLDTAILSCEEGKDGTWDCSTDEGKEGFTAIADDLEDVKSFLKTLKKK